VRKTDNLPPSFTVVKKSGNLNFLEMSGPSGPLTGLLYLYRSNFLCCCCCCYSCCRYCCCSSSRCCCCCWWWWSCRFCFSFCYYCVRKNLTASWWNVNYVVEIAGMSQAVEWLGYKQTDHGIRTRRPKSSDFILPSTTWSAPSQVIQEAHVQGRLFLLLLLFMLLYEGASSVWQCGRIGN